MNGKDCHGGVMLKSLIYETGFPAMRAFSLALS